MKTNCGIFHSLIKPDLLSVLCNTMDTILSREIIICGSSHQFIIWISISTTKRLISLVVFQNFSYVLLHSNFTNLHRRPGILQTFLIWSELKIVVVLIFLSFYLSSDHVDKVHIFWEGHKILQNLQCRFDWHYIGQIYGGDYSKFCGLLRIYELYHRMITK